MRHRHFTLIELLTVITIIAILAGITIGGLSYASGRADESKTIAIMTEFEDALEAYKKDYGVYPVCTTAKAVDFSNDEWKKFTNVTTNKRNKAYMEGAEGELIDAYGNAFFYQYPNGEPSRNTSKFALWSMGKDGKHGKKGTDADTAASAGSDGSDDICSWKSK